MKSFPQGMSMKFLEIWFSYKATDISTRDSKGGVCKPPHSTPKKLVIWVRIYSIYYNQTYSIL